MTSPLLGLPTAVPAPPESLDAAVAWHHGDPLTEQRAAARGAVVVDRSHRDVLVVPGADRLTWLHTLLSQHVSELADGTATEALLLDVNGRVEEHVGVAEVGGRAWLDTEPGHGAPLHAYLEKMRFWSVVEPAIAGHAVLTVLGPATADVLAAAGLPVPAPGHAATTAAAATDATATDATVGDTAATAATDAPGADTTDAPADAGDAGDAVVVARRPWRTLDVADVLVPRALLVDVWQRLTRAGAAAAGTLAFEALRAEAWQARLGVDTDDRTIPHEAGWIGQAVHLDKGCYRGQETVARVANLGRAPRRLVLLHLDGSDDLPSPGDDVTPADGGRAVGRVGTVAQHHELGAIALALVKRSVTTETPLLAGGCAAAIDPDSEPPDTGEPAGRAALRRLRG